MFALLVKAQVKLEKVADGMHVEEDTPLKLLLRFANVKLELLAAKSQQKLFVFPNTEISVCYDSRRV